MRRTERAVRAELRSLGVSTRSDGLAALAVDLAERLDDDELGDRVRAAYSRELRLALEALHERTSDGGTISDVEQFLARMSSSSFAAGD